MTAGDFIVPKYEEGQPAVSKGSQEGKTLETVTTAQPTENGYSALKTAGVVCGGLLLWVVVLLIIGGVYIRRNSSENLASSLSNLCCAAKAEEDLPECSICLDEIVIDNIELPCGHKFHESCVQGWISANQTCPYCRSEVIGV
jgi:hypothetical protein